jgi:hypothetical protein
MVGVHLELLDQFEATLVLENKRKLVFLAHLKIVLLA